jgi:hypothetical protein
MKPLMVGKRSTEASAGIIGKRRERLFYTGMATPLSLHRGMRARGRISCKKSYSEVNNL